MERIMSVEDKIRRAEAIYERRQQGNNKQIASINVSDNNKKKDIKLLKKMIIQILVCMVLYLIVYMIQNNSYVFSEDFINKANEILSNKLRILIHTLKNETNIKNSQELLYFFELLEKLKIQVEISNSQNIFYEMFCMHFEDLTNKIKNNNKSQDERKLLLNLLSIGQHLNINMDFYKSKVDQITGKI